MMDEEQRRGDWPERPWIMTSVGAFAGLGVHVLAGGLSYIPPVGGWVLARQASAAGLMVAAIAFLLTAERRRLEWAATFALVWGVVIGLVGYSTGAYNRLGQIAEFPFFAGLLAVVIAAPLFQAMRDEGAPRLPIAKVHGYAWNDAIIGGASLAFTGLSFLLAFLLAGLFDAIGIDVLRTLLRQGWFDWMVAGAAFGAASAVLRERAPLLGTLQRLVMLVIAVLAPVLAFALALFLLALPITGLGGLWKSDLPETPMLLSSAGFCFVFLNAIIGDSPGDRRAGRLWRWTEALLLFAALPLGGLALVSMSLRVSQYGWTPERIWGVVASLVAIAFGIANWLSVIRDRSAFDLRLREYQKYLAVGLCGVALLLALPIIDFGAISTKSQLARLSSGNIAPVDFDWTALAFDFGPSGRHALARIARHGSPGQRDLAAAALRTDSRYAVSSAVKAEVFARTANTWLRVLPKGRSVDQGLLALVAQGRECGPARACALVFTGPNEAFLVTHAGSPRSMAQSGFIREAPGRWRERLGSDGWPDNGADLLTAPVEVRTQTVRRIYVDGKPVGPPFE